jgi:hypothetical protein
LIIMFSPILSVINQCVKFLLHSNTCLNQTTFVFGIDRCLVYTG